MIVKLTKLQLSVLSESPETAHLLPRFLRMEPEPVLDGDGLPLSDFRDACADVLMRMGFDERYEPNAIGMAMEDLVDKLFQR